MRDGNDGMRDGNDVMRDGNDVMGAAVDRRPHTLYHDPWERPPIARTQRVRTFRTSIPCFRAACEFASYASASQSLRTRVRAPITR